jgi:hypothetical protein
MVTMMKNIKLNESDSTFIYYALRAYANQSDNLEEEDKVEIYEIANKFR